jgi:hypothetical protein
LGFLVVEITTYPPTSKLTLAMKIQSSDLILAKTGHLENTMHWAIGF